MSKTGVTQATAVGDVSEGSIRIIAKKPVFGLLIMRSAASDQGMCIHKIEVEIAIVVVVKESDSTSQCFRIKSSFFIFSAVMLKVQSKLFGDFREIPGNIQRHGLGQITLRA